MNSEESDASNHFYGSPVDDQGAMVFLKVHHLCLTHIKEEAKRRTPSCQLLHLHSVCGLVLVPDESHNCCVFCILNDLIRSIGSSTVMSE